MFDIVTFLHYSLSPNSLDFQRGKHRAALPARHAGSCSGQHPRMTPLGRRHRSEACGCLLVETWSKRHQGGDLFQEPGQSVVWGGLPKAGSSFPWDLLLA